MSRRIGHVLAELNALPQVTVAVIEGAAMAGGLGVACCCDVTIGMSDAKFGFSETRIGITPAQIARYVLQKCGYSTGRRLMVTAARFREMKQADLGFLILWQRTLSAWRTLRTGETRCTGVCSWRRGRL